MATLGGPAQPVSVQTGGRQQGGPAQPVAVVSDGRATVGGPAQPVYVVTSGPVLGGPALPVVAAASGASVAAGPAVPVYVVSGSLGGSATPSSLLTSLVAYWQLEEASGTRVDASGRGNNLAPNSTPGNTTGKVGNALNVLAASSQYLSLLDNTDLSMGDIDFTVALWFYSNSLGSKGIATKWQTVGNQREWWIGQITQTISFFVSSNGTATASQAASAAHSLNAFHFCVAWHDSVANTLNVQIDNGTVASSSYSAGVFNGAAAFNLGAENGGAFFDGRIDEAGVWKRVLTAAERTALFNANNGITYPFTGT